MSLIKNACVLMVLSAMASTAATVTFKSGDGTGESNNITGFNVLLYPNSLWAVDTTVGGLWVSHLDTGQGGTFIPNSNRPFARFTERFDTPAGTADFSGSITVWADDTATVWLNGILMKPANFVLGAHCAASPIGCQDATFAIFSATLLPDRPYFLDIDVYQLGGDTSGVMYSGTFSDTAGGLSINSQPTPEPSTFAMLGLGLAAAGLLSIRRR
ncbi:MAG: PEP-CTERM sorting domain-containing protein [Bryobacterales bacterium]|nr:PEP-CTERM sorting domain-containing protein [Bryobacterales bacterium]